MHRPVPNVTYDWCVGEDTLLPNQYDRPMQLSMSSHRTERVLFQLSAHNLVQSAGVMDDICCKTETTDPF